ncbi:hypothetical protein [Stakelama marina]|uniref:Protein kinase domain-containing protein n=1 Tax=Stakelama marina TaxID=2826939 RepID=A0A8T4IJ68_9SPHN|nr:hypothetical protein [Stakelama marina]MBR0553924.1 hypothetical protein [Stakelama marina]
MNLLQRSSQLNEGISEYYGYRVLVARNLAAIFHELHAAGHHMIDLEPANLHFYPATGWIAIVDTDGFSISRPFGRNGASMVRDDYIAPASYDRKAEKLGEPQNRFALAVIILQTLNNGIHPFSGTSEEGFSHPSDIQTRIRKGLYA